MKRHSDVGPNGQKRPPSFLAASDPSPTPDSGFSRKPLEATVDRGLAAKLFALEAEYYQDITLPSAGPKGNSRMIVDVLDSLSIGSGTALPSDDSDQISFFTETLVVSQFKANSVVIACNTLSGIVNGSLRSSISVSPAPKADFDVEASTGDGSPGAPGDDAGNILLLVESTKPIRMRSLRWMPEEGADRVAN